MPIISRNRVNGFKYEAFKGRLFFGVGGPYSWLYIMVGPVVFVIDRR